MQRASPYCGENPGPGKDVRGELDPTPGIREQPRKRPSSMIYVRRGAKTPLFNLLLRALKAVSRVRHFRALLEVSGETAAKEKAPPGRG
jgi:hypothetical protein